MASECDTTTAEAALGSLAPGAEVLEVVENRNSRLLKLRRDSDLFALRVRGGATPERIKAEHDAQSQAAARDAAPATCAVDLERCALIGAWAEGNVLDDRVLAQIRITQVAELLARLHRAGPCGTPAQPINAAIAKLEQVGSSAGALAQIKSSVSLPTTLIHGDVLPENVIVRSQNCVLIDWEYAGDADPMIDLASFALGAKLNEQQIETLLSAYCEATKCEPLILDQLVGPWTWLLHAVWTDWALNISDQPSQEKWLAWLGERSPGPANGSTSSSSSSFSSPEAAT